MNMVHSDLIAKANASVAAARSRISPDDLHRPRFHFQPPANWMNDPNGFIQWKGRYHLFYQHNPFGALWGNMHWGHAVSDDLIRWQHLPIAIAPTPDSYDKGGIYSGCIVDNDGVPTAIYTGVQPECQCIATSGDELLTWSKHPANPVIAAPPSGFDAGFRDPWVWREGNEWFMLVGSGRRGVGGAVLLYRSRNLTTWEYLHPMCEGDASESGRMWECPFFFPLGGKHVLVIHPIPLSRALYIVGTYRNQKFIPETRGTIDFGIKDFYATHFLRDQDARWIMIAWLREARSNDAQTAAGWSGTMSLPRVVSLTPDAHLAQQPMPGLESLRGRRFHAVNLNLSNSEPTLNSGVEGHCLEIRARLLSRQCEPLGLRVCRSADGQEVTTITYDPGMNLLVIDRSRSSLDCTVNLSPHVCPLRLRPGEPLELRVIVDHSIVEVFANGGLATTARIYPTRRDATGVQAWGMSGATHVESFEVWEINPAS